jgi:hypothetical protein
MNTLRVVCVFALLPALGACNMITGTSDLVVKGSGGEGGAASTGGSTDKGAGHGGAATGGVGGASTSTSTASSVGGASTSTTGAGPTTTGAGPTTTTGATTTTTTTTTSASSTTTGGGTDAAQICVDFINQKRATLNLPPFTRWTGTESCASNEAQIDYGNNTAHSAFNQCGEWAQNECPGWPGPPEAMIANCLQQMWDEGPGPFDQGHGHYDNMTNTSYTKVACGFYVTPSGDVWAAQDFQ